MSIKIPVYYVPRDYQLPVWEAMVEKETCKRAALIWPRRAGKDLTALNILAVWALTKRVGNYYYFAPTYAQGKKIIWDGKTKDGKPFLSCFPGYPYTQSEDPNSLIRSIDKREMKIELVNGSLFQVIGASDEDSIVGSNPVGCVFTEYSIQNPKFWAFMSPILLENDGWAIFPYTVRGFNHGWQLYQKTKDRPTWHTELRTYKTCLHNGKQHFTEEQIQEEIESGNITEEGAKQEYENDPYASNVGAYFGTELRRLKDAGRITDLPWQPEHLVHTSWDIGVKDSTVIWFFQVDMSGNVNVIDCLSMSGEGLGYYIKKLKEKPYVYGSHFGPHDLAQRNFDSGKSTLEVALGLGFRFTVAPKLSKHDQINAARAMLPRCRFDEKACFTGLDALRQYQKQETGLYTPEGSPIFGDKPLHNWASHYADSFMVASVVIDKAVGYNGGTGGLADIEELPEFGTPKDWDILG